MAGPIFWGMLSPSFRPRRWLAQIALTGLLAAPVYAQTAAQPGESTPFASQPPAAAVAATDGNALIPPADLARIEAYLNDITTIDSRFVQIAANGLAEGRIRLSRPSDMRVEYDPPVPILMVASGRLMMYHDASVKQTSFLPVSRTPAAFFLRDEVSLEAGLTITGYAAGDDTLQLSLIETENPDAGKITLVFADNPLRLSQWRVIDPQGTEVEVVLLDPTFGITLDDDLFSLVDPNLRAQ